jgi:hypothetical protein
MLQGALDSGSSLTAWQIPARHKELLVLIVACYIVSGRAFILLWILGKAVSALFKESGPNIELL